MKLFRVAAAFAALSGAAVQAGVAQAQMYVSGAVGANADADVDYRYDTGGGSAATNTTTASNALAASLAIGRTFGNFRAEFAYSYANWDKASDGTFTRRDDSGLTIQSFDLVGYYDFPIEGQLRPYVGFGVGLANVEFSDSLALSAEDRALHIQAIGGLSFPVAENLAAFGEVRYQTTTAPVGARRPGSPIPLDADTDISAYGFQGGLRLSF